MDPSLPRDIFQLKNQDTFREYALKVFHFQAERNPVYREYLQMLGNLGFRLYVLNEKPYGTVTLLEDPNALIASLPGRKYTDIVGVKGYQIQ